MNPTRNKCKFKVGDRVTLPTYDEFAEMFVPKNFYNHPTTAIDRISSLKIPGNINASMATLSGIELEIVEIISKQTYTPSNYYKMSYLEQHPELKNENVFYRLRLKPAVSNAELSLVIDNMLSSWTWTDKMVKKKIVPDLDTSVVSKMLTDNHLIPGDLEQL
jgi:hypothetical protein